MKSGTVVTPVTWSNRFYPKLPIFPTPPTSYNAKGFTESRYGRQNLND